MIYIRVWHLIMKETMCQLTAVKSKFDESVSFWKTFGVIDGMLLYVIFHVIR